MRDLTVLDLRFKSRIAQMIFTAYCLLPTAYSVIMTDWLRPLLLMFYAPTRGMAEVRDRAPLGPAVGAGVRGADGAARSTGCGRTSPAAPSPRAGAGASLSVVWMGAESVLFLAVASSCRS